jgi:hypothetical protein
VTYDAKAERWSGTLTITGRPTFTGSASGVFRLLETLDDRYRAWAVAKEKAATPA